MDLEAVSRLTKDLTQGTQTLSVPEARFLVDAYYSIQDYRIQSANQVRALSRSDEPHTVLVWLFEQTEVLEKQIHRALDKWTDTEHMGRWAKGVMGIGPVISAGLLAHIDITKAPTAGHIWSFAGLNPMMEWRKGEKRPWNADLKVICWKAGESFVKVSGNPKALYGKLYAERKVQEIERNERGEFAEQAAQVLARKKIGKDTEAYKAYSEGRLPPAHLHARAKRYAVKIFLSHWQAEAYRNHYGVEPPAPYPIAILGHVHMIEPSQERESCIRNEP